MSSSILESFVGSTDRSIEPKNPQNGNSFKQKKNATLTHPGTIFVNLQVHLKKIDTSKEVYLADVCSMLTFQEREVSRFRKLGPGECAMQPWISDGNWWVPQVFGFLDQFEPTSYSRIHMLENIGNTFVRRLRIYAAQETCFSLERFEEFPFDLQTISFSLLLEQGPIYKLRDAYFIDGQSEFEVVRISHETTQADFFGDSCERLWRYTMTVDLARKTHAYTYNSFVIVFVVGLLAPGCALLSLRSVFDRLQISLALLLILAIIRIGPPSRLSKPHALTRLDIQSNLALIMVSCSALETIVLGSLHETTNASENEKSSLERMLDTVFYSAYVIVWLLAQVHLFRKKIHRLPESAAEQIQQITTANWRMESDAGVEFEALNTSKSK